MKKILGVHNAPPQHWVGDGFPVRSLFSYQDLGKAALSPFLLLDHAVPTEFGPAAHPRGVGQHPHRGFETVTIVYQGELEHKDSTGAGGLIGPGDVQWMTAGAGILHEEFHSHAFTKRGGTIEMVQLWVNLPAVDKMSAPGYQTLLNADIPSVALPEQAGQLRVIAGEFAGSLGPSHTFTPIDVWDIRLNAGHTVRFEAHDGHTLALVILRGTVKINGETVARDGQLVHFDRTGTVVEIEADGEAGVLWLSGEPIDEPVVAYGPFVMNSERQIHEAMADFNSGRFGELTGARDGGYTRRN
ncbi:pirin family protein [Paraburkholderia denitrificans]|uniref:Pirin family protein n=1 Tax=Paraburkholderia denitrificans TaxID=694025 RepID=A0ABW0JCE8_9BURK